MKATAKIILTLTAALVMFGFGTASAAYASSADQLAANPGKVHSGPDGVGTKDVPPGAPSAGKLRKGATPHSNRATSYSVVRGYINSQTGLPLSGATVSLQYWSGSKWVALASTTANSNGYYSWRVYPGYYYRVGAAFIKSACNGGINGSIVTYVGVSGWVKALAGRAHTLSPTMKSTFRFC